MVHEFKSIGEYHRALLKRPEMFQGFDVSPGYAMQRLGVARQRVYQLIETGALDAVRTPEALLLQKSEVDAFRRSVHSLPLGRRIPAGRAWVKMKRANLTHDTLLKGRDRVHDDG